MPNLKAPVLPAPINMLEFAVIPSTQAFPTSIQWQQGNNLFTGVAPGRYKMYARFIGDDPNEYIMEEITIADPACAITIAGIRDVSPTCTLVIRGIRDITGAGSHRFTAIVAYDLPDEAITCEILANPHTGIQEALDRQQHHYGIVATNQIAGTIFSEAGQVSVDGGTNWTALTYLGTDSRGRKFAGYKITKPGTAIVPKLRTKDGCSVYDDRRLTEWFTSSATYKTSIAGYSNSPSPAGIDLQGIMIAGHMGPNLAAQGDCDLYEIWMPGHGRNLQIRINNGGWIAGNDHYMYGDGDVVAVQKASTAARKDITRFQNMPVVKKDFIMDVTANGGTTWDRYIVRRWTTGGHYSTLAVVKRMGDHQAWVCHTNAAADVEQRLVIGGTTYLSTPVLKSCFNIGNSRTANTTGVFGFPQTNTDWYTGQLLFDNV